MKKTAVLFVHGHMGSPKQFSEIINELPEDASVSYHNITLPGHGGKFDDFIHSDRCAWQKYVNDTIDKLREKHDRLILVGHSMGGLLLINSAAACPEKITAIIALSLPLYIKLTPRGMRIRARCIGKASQNEDPDISAARAMNGVSGITAAKSFRLLPNTFGLFKIMSIMRKALPKLSVPLTVINSSNDEITAMKTLAFIKKTCPKATLITLADASHFLFYKHEIRLIDDIINKEIENNV